MKAPNSVEEYIASFPENTQAKLKELRAIVGKYAPDAKEGISYGMPAYRGKRVLFYFGGFKTHISLFPTAKGIIQFEKELSTYKTSKGTVQFPIDEDLPEELISKIILSRIEDDNR